MITVIRYKNDRLDAVAAPNSQIFKRSTLEYIPEQRDAVILDLQHVKFVDSSGLGAVVSLMQGLNEKTKLLLCGGGDSVKTLLCKTQLDNIFPLHKDVPSAMEAI